MRAKFTGQAAQGIPLYSHQPLDTASDTIRFVKLLDSTSPSTIHCEVVHLPLLSTSYSCVSYVCGPPPATHPIYISGKRLLVRQNLYDYLLEARDSRKDQLLWIDAVCIDQTNVDERNHQVALMGRIFSRAAATDLWLGCGDASIEALLDQIGRSESKEDLMRNVLRNELCARPIYHNYDFDNGAPRLHSCKYWTRLWIMQEVILARHVFLRYGTTVLDCDNLNDYWHTMSSHRHHSLRVAEILALRYEYGMGKRLTLGDILSLKGRRTQCEDRRDQIYGILGLARDGGSFRIDYDEPVDDLFFRVLEVAERSQDCSRRTIRHLFDSLECLLDIPGSVLEAQIRDRYHLKVKIKKREDQWTAFLTNEDYRMLERAVKAYGTAHQRHTTRSSR